MHNDNKTPIDGVRINELLAIKEAADRDVREEMQRYAIFQSKISGVADSEFADTRIVAVVFEGEIADGLLGKIAKQEEVNALLVSEAPMYFKENAQSFRTPTVIRNVSRLKVTVNTAISSQLRTGEQLVARYDRAIKRTEKKLKTLRRPESKLKQQELIETLKAERAQFAVAPDKLYRLRSFEHEDAIALYDVAGSRGVLEKLRVNAGGIVAIKARDSSLQDFTVKRSKQTKSSVYENLDPIPNALDLPGYLYDEELADKIREERKRDRDLNVEKIRRKGDKFVN